MKNNYGSAFFLFLCFLLFIPFITCGPYAYAAPYAPPDRLHTDNCISLLQQQVRGTVRDPAGEPLPGVIVQVKTSTRGTSTDLDGNYEISASPDDTLVFSSVGSDTREVPVNGRNVVNVLLSERATALDAVTINAGYYRTTQRERTGNIAKVSAEEIGDQPVISPLEALQGRMAGVEVVQQSGIPGAAPSIYIRGRNSLRNGLGDNGNLPLYIIDGVTINSSPLLSLNQFTSGTGTDPLSALNPNDIASIEVLKDADATAIYGSRGANGVILITTKTAMGSAQKTKVNVQLYGGISRVAHFVDLLDTREYLALRRQAFENEGATPTESNSPDLLLWDQDRYTDWQRKLFGGTAQVTNMNLDVSGGSETTSFRLGGSYQKEGSVFPGDYAFEKKTVSLNLNHHTVDERFRMSLTANYGITDNDLFSSNSFVRNAFSLPPNAPAIYNPDGSLNWENSTWDNPLALLERDGRTESQNLVSNLGLQYRLMEGLVLKANLGYTYLDSKERIKIPVESYDPALRDRISPNSQHALIKRKSWIAEPQLTYKESWGDHHLDALVGATFQVNKSSTLRMTGRGYSNSHFIGNLGAADAVSVNEDREIAYKYNAVFARIGYNWARTYFVNLTGRRDGSSRFGPDNRFANFGAIGAGWIFSRENFTKNAFSWLSFGKLRGSYGLTGNDQIGDYRYLDTYEATPGPGGLYPTHLTNPDFSWETNRKLEAALELGFLRDRVNLNLSWYRNRSSNQLVGYPLPALTGFTTVEANLPATVENTGWEIELSSRIIESGGFSWRSSVNVSLPSNKLIRFDNIEQSSYANSYRVGKSLNIATLYQFDGVDPVTGFYRVIDADDNGSYDFKDRTVTIDLGRTYFGGLGNRLSYNNLTLNFLFEFVKQKGKKFFNGVPGFMANTVNRANLDRNIPADGQRPTQSITGFIAYSNAYSSNFGITNTSFVRLKTLSLGYSLPKWVLEKLRLSNVEFFLHGQNLLTFTDYRGLDPQNPGVGELPALQSTTVGVRLNL